VEALFTDSVNGLSKQMGNLMDGVARISIANPGSLVSMAGVGNSYTDTTSDINRDINQINDKLKDLWDKYERERARYWKKFNDMETILANYQAQSEWLYQTIMTGFDY
jgi:flagellar capping protein FliD